MRYQRNLKWVPYHSIVPFICINKRFRFRSPLSDAYYPKAGVFTLLQLTGHTNLSYEFPMQILLYSDKDFPDGPNEDILLLTPFYPENWSV